MKIKPFHDYTVLYHTNSLPAPAHPCSQREAHLCLPEATHSDMQTPDKPSRDWCTPFPSGMLRAPALASPFDCHHKSHKGRAVLSQPQQQGCICHPTLTVFFLTGRDNAREPEEGEEGGTKRRYVFTGDQKHETAHLLLLPLQDFLLNSIPRCCLFCPSYFLSVFFL